MNIYEQYAVLEAEIGALEAKKESLRADILKDMIEQGAEKVDTAVGKFSITRMKKWTYPEAVTDLEEKVKVQKALAQSTGDATYTESETLRFSKIKL